MNRSETIATFAPAFVAAQALVKGATKDATNPHFKSKYADLASVMDACKEALNENGIAVLQPPESVDGSDVCIETVLMHKSGEWVSGTMRMPMGKRDPQGYGSALTYARRYSLAAMVGVCPEDDDAEGATDHNGNGQSRPEARQPSTPPTPKTVARPATKPAVMSESDYQDMTASLQDAFDAAGFDPDAQARVIKASLAKSKVNDLRALCLENMKALVNAIATGKADKFKATASAAA